jgi:hypothetical protein
LIYAELLRFFKHVQVCAHGRKTVPFLNMRTDFLSTTSVTQKEQAFAALAGVQVSYLQFKYPDVLQNAHCPSAVPVLADTSKADSAFAIFSHYAQTLHVSRDVKSWHLISRIMLLTNLPSTSCWPQIDLALAYTDA